ncbi:GDP-mannose 4,6-dehydratase [Chlamydiota bacterium]
MKALITGGAGFIGSHLAEKLLVEGHRVFIIDDLSTGAIENIAHLKENPHFTYVIEDIKNIPVVAELVDQVDVVFHLAAAVGVKLIVEQPVKTIETNIHGTQIILNIASKKKKKVIIASTSEVYGKKSEIPFLETDDILLGPTYKFRWCYACSKAIDEFLGLAYWKEKGLPVVIVRFFNTVGERQTGQYGMVIPTFVRQALKNEDITVYGTGKQTRCFCYVDDITTALIRLAFLPEAVGVIFNLGSTDEISIRELAQIIKKRSKSNSKIVLVPYDQAYEEGFEDLMRRKPSIRKAEQYIGFAPQFSIDYIIDKVIAYEKTRV